MRLLLCVAAGVLLVAVVLGIVPLAWGFVALAVEIFMCFVAIYDLLTPVARIDQDDD